MNPVEVERMYEAIAGAIDAVGPGRAEVYLAKLALALAHESGDARRALELVALCRENLDG